LIEDYFDQVSSIVYEVLPVFSYHQKINITALVINLIFVVSSTMCTHSFYKLDQGVQITIIDYLQEPEKLVFMADNTPITAQYCLDAGFIPCCVNVFNTNKHSVSVKCAIDDVLIASEADVVYALQYYSFLKSFYLFSLSSLISIGTLQYTLMKSKKELLDIVRGNLFDSNIKNGIDPEVMDVPLFKDGIEWFSKLGFNVSKNIPSASGISVADEVVIEEINRLHRTGGFKAIYDKLDWQRMQTVIFRKTPCAAIVTLTAGCMALLTPFYWWSLYSTNRAIAQAVSEQIVQTTQVIMPGETISSWIFVKKSGLFSNENALTSIEVFVE